MAKPGLGFIASGVLLHTVPPLLPLVAEWMAKGSVNDLTISLSASIYCFGIAIGSKRAVVFTVGLILGITLCYSNSIAAGQTDHSVNQWIFGLLAIVIMLVLNSLERIERHGEEEESIINFEKW